MCPSEEGVFAWPCFAELHVENAVDMPLIDMLLASESAGTIGLLLFCQHRSSFSLQSLPVQGCVDTTGVSADGGGMLPGLSLECSLCVADAPLSVDCTLLLDGQVVLLCMVHRLYALPAATGPVKTASQAS